MRPFRNTGWKYYAKMQDILPRGSSARGRTAYQPSVAQASMPVTNLADHNVNMGDPDVADADSDIAGLYPDVPMVATPTSSYAGKRSHSDMEPTGATTATAFTISEPRHHQGEPDPPKKQKSSRGGTPSSRTSQRSTVKGDKTNAVAMVAIQNSISHLSDTLVATLSNTDESLVGLLMKGGVHYRSCSMMRRA
jgi:hypothetical protein